jgi:hypothetical protein
MHSKSRIMLVTMFFLALAVSSSEVLASSSLPTAVTGDTPVTANSAALSTPVLELLGRWDGGPVYSSAVSGDHLYFGMGGGIRVLRIKQTTEQSTPSWQEVASITTSGLVHDLTASG